MAVEREFRVVFFNGAHGAGPNPTGTPDRVVQFIGQAIDVKVP